VYTEVLISLLLDEFESEFLLSGLRPGIKSLLQHRKHDARSPVVDGSVDSCGGIIFAIGFSLGLISLGLISLGLISLGLISLGLISLGLISLGLISLGLISLGFSLGFSDL
jgi:hypothetical protein